MTDRLSAFPAAKVDSVRRKLGATEPLDWPRLDGVLAILFTSRSGSTFLARELEEIFAVGEIREALNPPRVKGKTAVEILDGPEDGWFAFKAGGAGVVVAELSGFFDAYIDRVVFIRLVRRDIVAQAISREKALQTAQFHSTQRPKGQAVYDARAIARSIKLIAVGVERISAYLGCVERPWRTLVYEDFSGGDFGPAIQAGDALGAPRRQGERRTDYRPVEKIGDAANIEWAARFNDEMDSVTRACVDKYLASI